MPSKTQGATTREKEATMKGSRLAKGDSAKAASWHVHGKSHGQRSLERYGSRDLNDSDTT